MPGRRGEAWNNEDVALLRRLASLGMTVPTIARALERSQEAVAGRARLLKISIERQPRGPGRR